MSEVEKSCDTCEYQVKTHGFECSDCNDHVLSEWQESELSKYQRKLEIATDALNNLLNMNWKYKIDVLSLVAEAVEKIEKIEKAKINDTDTDDSLVVAGKVNIVSDSTADVR